jgi:hypothetical protein
MDPLCQNRLTVVGPKKDVARFENEFVRNPDPGLSSFELLEITATRVAWQFETAKPPLAFIKQASLDHPGLTLLLEYDREDRRVKGLAKAKEGRLRHHRVKY